MSLKDQKSTADIFTRYGLTEEEYKTYLIFLGQPQTTVAEVADILEKDIDPVAKITAKLEEKKFIKKIPGVVERFLPLEPYFELYNKESQTFRTEIGQIKDTVLGDQSKRFEKLEGIEKNAVKLIDTAVNTQVNDFFKDSDSHDVDKKAVIDGARDRLTKTGKSLEEDIQKMTFAARDRFTSTSKGVEKSLQDTLFKGRDRYETTSKTLESDLHKHMDDNYSKFKTCVDTRDTEEDKVWDSHNAKFTGDNNALNGDLDKTTKAHVSQTKTLEANVHKIIEDLNSQLKAIATEFKNNYNSGIVGQKETLNKITDALLKDFADRLAKLQMEMKKDLDAHVDHHKENANALKPKLEEILDKYILRMKNVIEELKKTISKLLLEHTDHVEDTTTKLANQLNERVEERQNQLVNQVQTFEKNTVILIDNLKDISDKMAELGTTLSSRGSAWKALFLGRHKYWQDIYGEIQERIAKISGTMKTDFKNSTANYIQETGTTKGALQQEISEITKKENDGLKGETQALDTKQQETINAELEGLASDLAKETDATLQHNIKHCADTTIKLKDSLDKTLTTHKEDYDLAINRHRQTGLTHYDTSNGEVKNKVDTWFSAMDKDHATAKNMTSTEVTNQIKDVNDHYTKTKEKNDAHSKEFDRDVKEIKTNQRRIFDDLEREVLDDEKVCKGLVSEKVNNEIKLIKEEVKQMDDFQHQKLDEQISLFTNEIADLDQKQHKAIDEEISLFADECTKMEDKLHAMLEDQKAKYQENAHTLQQELTKTIKDNIQNVKDAIADFTLNFMNSIDEGNEVAETNEQKLTEIFDNSLKFIEQKHTSTWHTLGSESLIGAINDAIWRTKSTVIVVTPIVVPKVLEVLSQCAYKKKNSRFFYTSNFDLATYQPILDKMKQLGNIQFRNLKGGNEFYACARDAEEVILAPNAKDQRDMIGIVSVQDGYCQLYSSFIGPIFQANSRPI